MKVKKNYGLLIGILLFIIVVLFVILFAHPVEYMYEKIQEDLARNEDNYLPDKDIPTDYYSANQYNIDVKHYSINLDIDTETKNVRGETSITVGFLKEELLNLDLNFYNNMSITRLQVNGVAADYTHNGTRLSVEIPDGVQNDFQVQIDYEGTPENIYFGSFNFNKRNNQPVIYTINEPIFASTWFPCNDLPDDKATYDISVVADSSLTVASIGNLVGEEYIGERKVTKWSTKYPASSYLMSLYIADYELITETINIGETRFDLAYYVFSDHKELAKYDFADHAEYLKFFSEKFGNYAFGGEKYGIAEFLWSSGAIENQTITGVGSNFITGDRFYENLFIHELAHHWWGNAVGPKSWKDIWLNEGFATYSESLYKEYKYGEELLRDDMDNRFRYFDNVRLYNPGEDLFNRGIYDKGAWVLHMLRKEVGEDALGEILRNYYEEYKYKNASTFDFKEVCERVSGKDLSKFFEQWVTVGKGIIEIEYEVYREDSKNYLKMQQIQTGYDVYEFPLEVKYFYKGNKSTNEYYITSADTTIEIASGQLPVSVGMNPNSWLLADFVLKKP